MLPKANMIEHKSTTFSTDNLNGFNLYTMVDRRFAIPTNQGPVTKLGLYSTVVCSWKPKIVQEVYNNWEVIYSHPSAVNHTGTGWEWVTIPRTYLNALPTFAAGYFADNIGVISTSPGPRSEYYGDALGVVSFTPGNYSTPALGAITAGIETPVSYFTNFDYSSRDGVGSWATNQSVSNNIYTVSGWTNDDDNHIDSGNILSLLIFINRISPKLKETIGVPVNFTKARITARFRGVNYDPKQSHCYPWIQGTLVSDRTKYANYFQHTLDLNPYLTSGNWETVDFELSDNPADWTWANGNVAKPTPQYSTYQDFETTVLNGENFHFPAVRPLNTPQPTGSIEWDYFGITMTDQ